MRSDEALSSIMNKGLDLFNTCAITHRFGCLRGQLLFVRNHDFILLSEDSLEEQAWIRSF